MAFLLSEMRLTSSAFGEGERIPTKYSGEGENVSPPLEWSNPPEGTQSFVVFCHDPDAPLLAGGAYGFVHWVLYGIPGDVTSLAEATGDYVSGNNGFSGTGYGGPMPPEGHGAHRYFFWVVALSQDPGLEPGLDLAEVLRRIEPLGLGMNRLVGVYRRG